MVKKPFNSWSAFYQQINFVFNSIIAVTLLPFAWIFLELEKGSIEPLFQTSYAWVIYLLFAVGLGYVLYDAFKKIKKNIQSIPADFSENERMTLYYEMHAQHYLLLGSCALVSMVATYVMQVYFFAICYLVILFFFSLNRPKFDRIIKELKITQFDNTDLSK